jgi:anti-sigma factor RsiW
MQKITDEQLLTFLDGKGDERDRQEIENGIRSNPELKKRFSELKSVHLFLQSTSLQHPSKNFTDQVMNNLHLRPSSFMLSPKNGMILLLGILIASGLALTLISSGTFDAWHSTLPFDASPLKNKWVIIPSSLSMDVKLFVKIVVLFNAALALILLDRTILRPYFQKRRFDKII